MLRMPFKIVHISPTPLVAAPSKIAAAQRALGHNAINVVLSDYPESGALAGKFIHDALLPNQFTKTTIEKNIAEADIIHVHNSLLPDQVQWILSLNQSAKFVYQVHSPLREGPLYISRASNIELPFSVFLVVGQYQPRHYPNYIAVPNIVFEHPTVRPRQEGEKLRIMYSPTHTRAGRWNNKYSKELEVACQALVKLGKVELVFPEKAVDPKTLFMVRSTCHVTVDEISTGGFHQISLEGLCAGNIVINRADYFSKAIFSRFTGQELPPFIYADGGTIADLLIHLADDVIQTVQLQLESFNYSRKNLDPNKLAEFYDAAYQTTS